MPRMRQILVEVHNAPSYVALDFFDSHEEAGYVRFHKEPNIQYNDGSCVEYAFLGLDKEFMPRKILASRIFATTMNADENDGKGEAK